MPGSAVSGRGHEQTVLCDEKMKMTRYQLLQWHHKFMDFLFPRKCLICSGFHPTILHSEIPADFQTAMSPFLCTACAEKYIKVQKPICTICGLMLKPDENGPECRICYSYPRTFRRCRSYGIYEHSLKDAIHLIKYNEKTGLAAPLGRLLFSVFMANWNAEEIDWIIPVPMHIKKMRKRGFNQAYLLIKDWPKLTEKKENSVIKKQIQKEALIRIHETDSQVGMDRETRQKNIRNAFIPNPKLDFTGRKILVVDDVFTSGATANECARTLLDAGAARVDVLTLAQTPKRI